LIVQGAMDISIKDGFVLMPVETCPNPWWSAVKWIKEKGAAVRAPAQFVVVGSKVEMSTNCLKGDRETPEV
jgi:hypothetical protein